MKKFTFIAALFMSTVSAVTVSAQSFVFDKADTVKGYFVKTGDEIQVYDKALNTTSAPIKITWKMVDYSLATGWKFNGFCDNNLCRDESVAGLVSGTKEFTSFDIEAGTKGDFHILYNADAAANGTSSYATIYFYNSTVPADNAMVTFIAYKDATGVVTLTRADENVTLYPNPAQNYIDVRYSSSADVKTISVYNIIGKLINVYKVSSNTSAHCEFNTDMPSGIYLMRMADSKGNIIATRKFTRQ